MRYKISISVPALLAATLFIFGVILVLYYYLTVTNGKFKISITVPTIGVSLVGLFILAAFAYVFLKRGTR
jgi:drug/metabolite transporter (DMT)-like permease